ncbi:MAG: 3-hydroxyacyl-CoA dehydrogenase [Burkholderiaceae bacterium]
MTSNELKGAPLLVVGAGIMGAGIAQVAAQAGHAVLLYDTREGAAAEAKAKLGRSLEALVAKGRMAPDDVARSLARIEPVASLDAAASVPLVVEAIVESLDAKRELFRDLERRVAADCVLATNTSSISITAIGNGLQHPQRLVGMHFFNPVPLMKLVEVVSGLQTDAAVAQSIFELSQAWGKVPVHARSTPGFIVNRIARPYYAETLALLQERAATPEVLDACLRGAGFRMGACELMDLIGHDTNFAVTNSVFQANFYDKRFVPSLVQRELVDAGLLGRKSGRGFFDYAPGVAAPALPPFEAAPPPAAQRLVVCGSGLFAERLASTLAGAFLAAGRSIERDTGCGWVGLHVRGGQGAQDAQLRLTDGVSASRLGAELAVFDLPLSAQAGSALAWAPSVRASQAWCEAAPTWLRALGFNPQRVADAPGLVVARTIAMLINEAADAVQQGVCTPQGADAAMKLGLNYPAGPFEWLARWDAAAVIGVLDGLDAVYRGERYRVSAWLQQFARRGSAA